MSNSGYRSDSAMQKRQQLEIDKLLERLRQDGVRSPATTLHTLDHQSPNGGKRVPEAEVAYR